ncbi:MarR family transcriptional regulator [Shewanella sp. WXL01]|uniref:MarR family winged helix-turn-helix transcriptional regulator n=1 Tax=Shewanella sp. WXL01 TaxID=2709721 RepID=UPI0014383009|nr:MarR family transcriptional regulator [Shewanella sp. WXL01]NKF50827.1 MarR family transcriptional regulator [Shewanella sp. WXL01]
MSKPASLENIFKLLHAVKKQMHQHIEEADLGITPMHVRVLKIIGGKPACTAIDVANFLGRDKAQVTRLLNTLMHQELIAKRPNPNDKRSQCLCVTDAGEDVLATVADIDLKVTSKMTQGLSDEQQLVFEQTVSKIVDNLGK